MAATTTAPVPTDAEIAVDHLNRALAFGGLRTRAYVPRGGDVVSLTLSPDGASWLAGLIAGQEVKARRELIHLLAVTDELTEVIADEDLRFVPAGDVARLAAAVLVLGSRIVAEEETADAPC